MRAAWFSSQRKFNHIKVYSVLQELHYDGSVANHLTTLMISFGFKIFGQNWWVSGPSRKTLDAH